MLYKGEAVIDDSNVSTLRIEGRRTRVGRRLFHNGDESTPALRTAFESSSTVTMAEAGLEVFSRQEIFDRAKEQAQQLARMDDFCLFPAYDQDGLGYCWGNCLAQWGTAQRLKQGLPLKVLSSGSICAPIKRGRNQGGSIFQAASWAAEHGVCSVDLWGNNARDWRRLETDAVRAERAVNKPFRYIRCSSDLEFASALVQGRSGVIAYDWWNHALFLSSCLEIERGSLGFRTRNSHGVNYGAANDHGFKGFLTLREGKGSPTYGLIIDNIQATAA